MLIQYMYKSANLESLLLIYEHLSRHTNKFGKVKYERAVFIHELHVRCFGS